MTLSQVQEWNQQVFCAVYQMDKKGVHKAAAINTQFSML